MATAPAANIDHATVADFGREWAAFDQAGMPADDAARQFDGYFGIFPLYADEIGFDAGCGSGRWAAFVAPQVKQLVCFDPSADALGVAQEKLAQHGNVRVSLAAIDEMPIADESQDFGYALGVLHHCPDTEAAMRACVRKLKPGGRFLVYLYYRFDNRPAWFRMVWALTDPVRRFTCRLPFPIKRAFAEVVAATVYLPLTSAARLLERFGVDVSHIPLAPYRHRSYYSMRTDALDRFGTRLEQRFTRREIEAMMYRCGLSAIRFSDAAPYWVACGVKGHGAIRP
jgi:SAM-dependent methyltransferase